jgi:predicted nucleic acid-binding Zn ribbon protein
MELTNHPLQACPSRWVGEAQHKHCVACGHAIPRAIPRLGPCGDAAGDVLSNRRLCPVSSMAERRFCTPLMWVRFLYRAVKHYRPDGHGKEYRMELTATEPIAGQDRLTHSSEQAFLACPRLYYWAYEKGWRTPTSKAPLRIGSAGHLGIDLLAKGRSLEDMGIIIEDQYAQYEVDYADHPDFERISHDQGDYVSDF